MGILHTPSRHTFECDGTQRVFPIPSYMISQDFVRIELDSVLQSDRKKWDIVNNSLVFSEAPISGAILDVQVSSDSESLGELGMISNVDIVAANINNVNLTGSNIEAVKLVSENIFTVTNGFTEIKTVADDIDDINTVANNIDVINTVSTMDIPITTIFNNIGDINYVAENIDNIDIVADNINTVNEVSAMNIPIYTIYDNIGDINNVSDNIEDIKTVTGKATELAYLADSLESVDEILPYTTQIQIVGNDLANSYEFIDDYGLITDVVTNEPKTISNIETVATNIDAIIDVYGIKDDIATLNAHTSEVNTVATNIADINTIVTNIDAIADVYSIKDDIITLNSLTSEINTIATNIADINTVVANITDIQNSEANSLIAKEEAWKAEAERLTAKSYATEPEDVFVKLYTSNNDGTFTTTNTSDYSAYHWERKASDIDTSGIIDDTGVAVDRAYSSDKVVELLEGKLNDNNGVIDLGSITDIVE